MKKAAGILFFAAFVVAVLWGGAAYSRRLDRSSQEEAARLAARVAEETQRREETARAEEAKLMGQLKIEDVRIGTGEEAKPGDTLSVHYTGTLADGTKFDSSYDRGTPFSFRLGAGEVIRGWDLGVAGMRVGGIRKLVIPPELGYGERGVGAIPASSELHFTVELVEVKK